MSKSGYYSWRDRPQSQTAIRREELSILIKDVFQDSDGTYGYRRIQAILERRGVRSDGATIRSIMRDLRLQAEQPRVKVRTTVPTEDLDERPALLRRDSRPPTSPVRSCVGTFPRKREVPPPMSGRGPASFISRPFWTADALKVVGYAMGDHKRTSLVCQAIDMAVRRCPIEEGVS